MLFMHSLHSKKTAARVCVQVKRPTPALLETNPGLKVRIEAAGEHNEDCREYLSHLPLSKALTMWIEEMLAVNPDPYRIIDLIDDPDLCGDAIQRPPMAWHEKGA